MGNQISERLLPSQLINLEKWPLCAGGARKDTVTMLIILAYISQVSYNEIKGELSFCVEEKYLRIPLSYCRQIE